MKMLKLNNKTITKIKWGVLLLLFSILFFTCLYDDLLTTYNHSLNFLVCIFNDYFLKFYEYTLSRTCFELPADYYILIYIIFGIWSFPIFVLSKLIEFETFALAAVLWMKLILVPFIVGILFLVYKMLQLLKEDKVEHTIFMMCSSLLFVLPIAFIGQYDIISLFFLLAGIYFCMKDERMSWKAVAMFSIAIPLKLMAVFPVVLLILIQEKTIFGIIKKIIGSFVGLCLCVVPYINDPSFHQALESNGGWFEKLSNVVLPSGWEGISLFWFTFFVLCIVAYKMKQVDMKQYLKQVTWILTAFYGFFFAFVEAHPQWSVLMVPFMSVLIREENSNFKLNMLLDTIAGIALVISQAYYFNWVYFTDRTSWLLLKSFSEKKVKYPIVSLTDFDGIERIIPLVNAAFLAAIVGILIVNHPWKKTAAIENKEELNKDIYFTKIGISSLRILCIFGYIVMTFLITYKM